MLAGGMDPVGVVRWYLEDTGRKLDPSWTLWGTQRTLDGKDIDNTYNEIQKRFSQKFDINKFEYENIEDHPTYRFFNLIYDTVKYHLQKSGEEFYRKSSGVLFGLSKSYFSTPYKLSINSLGGVPESVTIESILYNIESNPELESAKVDFGKIRDLIDRYRVWCMYRLNYAYEQTEDKKYLTEIWSYRPHRPSDLDINYKIRKKMWLLRELQYAFTMPGEKVCSRTELGKQLFPEIKKDAIFNRFFRTEKPEDIDIFPADFFRMLISVKFSDQIVDRERAVNALYDYGKVIGYDTNNPTHRILFGIYYLFLMEPSLKGFRTDEGMSMNGIARIMKDKAGIEVSEGFLHADRLNSHRYSFSPDSVDKLIRAIDKLVIDKSLVGVKSYVRGLLDTYKSQHSVSAYFPTAYLTNRKGLEKLAFKFPKLATYIETIPASGKFTVSFLDDTTIRVSSFNRRLTYIDTEIKGDFVAKALRKFVTKINRGDQVSEEYSFVLDLIEYCQKERFQNGRTLVYNGRTYKYTFKEVLTGANGAPAHEFVLTDLTSDKEYVVATEAPIYLDPNDGSLILTGHVDLLIIQGETLYVCDYKPDQVHGITTRPSDSFINSVPQLATYALMLKKQYNVKNIECVTFNGDGAWVFDPAAALKEVTQFMDKNREGANLPWRDYLPLFGIDLTEECDYEEAYDGGVSFIFRLNQYFSEELADELVDLGDASYNEKRYMNFVVKNYDDKTIWIKEGSVFSGLMHIYVEHSEDFDHYFQISDPIDIATLIAQTITELDPVDGPHPTSNPDYDRYDYNVEGTILRIIVNRNTGYIITAYPRD